MLALTVAQDSHALKAYTVVHKQGLLLARTAEHAVVKGRLEMGHSVQEPAEVLGFPHEAVERIFTRV